MACTREFRVAPLPLRIPRLGRFTLPSRLRVSAVALSAFAITRLGRCSLPSRVSRLGPLCLRGFGVSAVVHTFSVAHPLCLRGFASRPLCTPLVWLTLSAFAFLRLGLLHTSSVAHSFARPLRGFLCTLVCDSFVHVSCVAFLVDSMQPPPFGSGMFG